MKSGRRSRRFALSGLGELDPKQRKSIEAMGLAIVNKLLHQPTSKLRALSQDPLQNHLAGAAAELFGLAADEPVPPPVRDVSLPASPRLAVGAKGGK